MNLFRWLARNLTTLVLAFILSVVVWVSAVVNVDPNVEAQLSRQVLIEIEGEDPNLRIMNEFPNSVTLTLLAPQSVWNQLEADRSTTRAWVNLEGLGDGEFSVPVNIEIDFELVRVLQQEPKEVTIRRERIVTNGISVDLVVNGDPPLGYEARDPVIDPVEVTVSGPESLVERVFRMRAQVDISGEIEDVSRMVSLTPVDINDRVVTGLTVSPSAVSTTVPIELLGGYRSVVVKVVTTGTVASGYRLTNYLVSPASVVVFSANPRLVETLPGYVQTVPLDLSDADDDFESLLELDLPDGVTVATDPKVLVQVSIAAIEDSLSVSLPIEITGLAQGLMAELAPGTVDVILTGPVPVLNVFQPSDIRVKVDLTSYLEGTHQLIPVIDFLPAEVKTVSVSPATIEVTIAPIPTATPTPFFSQPTPILTPSATLTPTPTP